MQASPLPRYKISTTLASFAALPVALIWRRLLRVHCPALRFSTIEARDSRERKIWELEATDRDRNEPAEREQWQRADQILSDQATGWAVGQLVMAEHRKSELEQLALDIRQECLCSIANQDDTGQTHRILRLLTEARIDVPSLSNNFGKS